MWLGRLDDCGGAIWDGVRCMDWIGFDVWVT